MANNITSKLREILAAWNHAELEATIAYYKGPCETPAQERALKMKTMVGEARRVVMTVLARNVVQDENEDVAKLRFTHEARSAAYLPDCYRTWMVAVCEDALARIDGKLPLNAALPDCGAHV